MKLRLRVTQVSSRLQSILVGEAICISFLIFRISVNAEESRQASNNFIVVMNHVWHSNYDLWFRAFLKCMTLWVKLALSSVKKKRTFRLSGMTET